MSFKLADLFVQITGNSKQLSSTLQSVQGQLTGMVGMASGVGGRIAGGIMGPLTGLVGGVTATGLAIGAGLAAGAAVGLTKCAFMASDLGETMDKVKVIFGTSAEAITKEADRMAEKFGAAKNEYINAASNFGAVFKEMGESTPQAAKLGNQLAKLGMDMASLDNSTNPEAFTAISAALRGEFNPLEQYRVFLNAATVATKAVAMGLAKTTSEVSESAKKHATLALIMEKTTDASGNLEETADSAANQWKRFTGQLQNLGETVGSIVLPAFTALLRVVNFTLGKINGMASYLKSVFDAAASFLGLGQNAGDEAAKLAKYDARNAQAAKDRAKNQAEMDAVGKDKTKKKEEKEARAETLSFQDFAKRLQEGAFGEKEKVGKEQLKVQREQLAQLKRMDGSEVGSAKPVDLAAESRIAAGTEANRAAAARAAGPAAMPPVPAPPVQMELPKKAPEPKSDWSTLSGAIGAVGDHLQETFLSKSTVETVAVLREIREFARQTAEAVTRPVRNQPTVAIAKK